MLFRSEVVGVFVLDTVLGFGASYNVKLGPDNSWITAHDTSIVLRSRQVRSDIWSPLNQSSYPVDADLGAASSSQQLVSHTANISVRGSKSIKR